ncbi:MAG TPA: sodium:solute symporter family protein [Vicinamibacteria bacterium]|nr:sodium:solute symporter family protein [Vicinamibacteria bacterium]
MTFAPSLLWLLGGSLAAYVVGLYALCFRIQGRIQTSEDYLVAGRKLTLPFATATILATWFGAGTVLTAADEVRASGLKAAALEPLGSGVCLLIAGWFMAGPIWKMKLLTLSDLFRARFGRHAEVLSALVMVPSYFGWVAAQFVALAGMLQLFFGIDLSAGILIVALVGSGYTLLGGMWSVTLTDALQMALVLAGLLVLGFSTLTGLGEGSAIVGLVRLWNDTPPELRNPIPATTLRDFTDWVAVFAIAALGNLPSQDIVQRISASRTSAVARRACLWSGCLYISFGIIPVGLGLAGRILFPESLNAAILPALAHGFTQPFVAVTFTVMLASAVLSSIDSGILAPAAVLSENLFRYANRGRLSSLTLNRIAVAIVGAGSLAMAYSGQSAYGLLEDSYEVVFVSLFVPMAFAVYGWRCSGKAAVASMSSGILIWFVHWTAGWQYLAEPFLPVPIPASLSATVASLLAYLAFCRTGRGSSG